MIPRPLFWFSVSRPGSPGQDQCVATHTLWCTVPLFCGNMFFENILSKYLKIISGNVSKPSQSMFQSLLSKYFTSDGNCRSSYLEWQSRKSLHSRFPWLIILAFTIKNQTFLHSKIFENHLAMSRLVAPRRKCPSSPTCCMITNKGNLLGLRAKISFLRKTQR